MFAAGHCGLLNEYQADASRGLRKHAKKCQKRAILGEIGI
jgi:hypothetical protein